MEKYLLLVAGIGVILPQSTINDIADFAEAELQPTSTGAILSGRDFSLLIPLPAIQHMLDTYSDIYIYSGSEQKLVDYMGSLSLERDELLQIRGAIKVLEQKSL